MEYRTLSEAIRERDAALLSGDVEQLRTYMIKAGIQGARKVPAKVLEVSLHKSRVNWRGCPPDKLYESVWWLLDRGYDLMIANGVGMQ